MRTGFFWVVTQRVVVIPYRLFGTKYRPHIQGSRIQRKGSYFGFLAPEDGTDMFYFEFLTPEVGVDSFHFGFLTPEYGTERFLFWILDP